LVSINSTSPKRSDFDNTCMDEPAVSIVSINSTSPKRSDYEKVKPEILVLIKGFPLIPLLRREAT